jgi:hypothetical protein
MAFFLLAPTLPVVVIVLHITMAFASRPTPAVSPTERVQPSHDLYAMSMLKIIVSSYYTVATVFVGTYKVG